MIQYRPEIDGLRAVAVILVILFHSGVGWVSGGYVGVDVFFVISGYLITSIILTEISTQRFSLLGFYERRARRILPALILVSLVSAILGWIILNPVSVDKLGNSLAGVATFTSNLVFWRQEGYFEESAELLPLIHTWSLGVEEQFYIAFPFLIILLSKLQYKHMYFWLLAGIMLSLILSIWSVDYQHNQQVASAAFFLLPARAWELGLGALIAVKHQENKGRIVSIRVGNFLGLTGMGLILFAMLVFDKDTPFPGMSAIVPVIGAGLVIAGSGSGTWVGRCLSLGPVVFIGLMSYSLYLWHQVLMAYWRNSTGQADFDFATTVTLVLVTSFIAYLSLHFVERPFRNRKFLRRRTIFLMSLGGLVVIGILGWVTKWAVNEKERFLAYQLSQGGYVYFFNMNERKFMQSRLEFNLPEIQTVVMGSSRVMQIGSETVGEPVLNMGVSGASVEDYVAFVPEAVRKVGARKVFLGADPWLFNENSYQGRWRSVEELYRYWSRNLSDCSIFKDALTDSIPEQLSWSGPNWAARLYYSVNRGRYTTTKGERESIAKKRFDGFHVYDEQYANRPGRLMERSFPGILDYSMTNYTMDIDSQHEYIRLIQCLEYSGVDVVLVLSPYHPKLFEIMQRERPEFVQIEGEFRRIAEMMEVPIIGSYDGAEAGCNSVDFYDGMHPRERCMRKIVSEE